MRKFTLPRAILLLSLLFSSACSAEWSGAEKESEGAFSIALTVDPTLLSDGASSAAGEIPNPDDFAIELYNRQGSLLKRWERLGDMPSPTRIQAGTYTLKAVSGELRTAAFEAPCYAGECTFSVSSVRENKANLTCRLANTQVTVAYKEGFKNYFKACETRIRTTGDTLLFAQGENRSGYFEPGKLRSKLTITKQDGTSFDYTPPVFDAWAQEYYALTFDVEEGAGGALLKVTFDDETIEQPVDVLLNPEWGTNAAPFLTPTGFEPGEAVALFEGEKKEASLLITARNGIQRCIVSTDAKALLDRGWPASVDLANPGETNKNTLERFGFRWTKTLGRLTMGQLDFSALIPELTCTGNEATSYSFRIEVTDNQDKNNEPFSLNLLINKPSFNFTATSDVFLNAASGEAVLCMPTGDVAQVKLSTLDNWGRWIELPYTVKEQDGVFYTLSMQLDRPKRAFQLRAKDDRYQREAKTTVNVLLDRLEICEADPADIWARKLRVAVAMQAGADPAEIALQRQTVAGWETVAAELQDPTETTAYYAVGGLEPGSGYTFRVLYGKQSSNEKAYTTEAALDLPNGGFENWTQSYSKSVNKGGRYKPAFSWKQETATVAWHTPGNGWATVNAKTVPAGPKTANTWYMVPSTVQSGDARTGNYAALIRNVAWDNNGGTPPENSSIFGSIESLTAPTIAMRSAGKLFLGGYAASFPTNSNNVAENYDEGLAFASRPASLKGYYKYSAIGGDRPYIHVVVEHRENGTVTSLGEATLTELTPAADYTSFEATINYTNTKLKATHLRVFFASSSKQNRQQSLETGIVTNDNKNDCVSLGSQLYIDDLELTY